MEIHQCRFRGQAFIKTLKVVEVQYYLNKVHAYLNSTGRCVENQRLQLEMARKKLLAYLRFSQD